MNVEQLLSERLLEIGCEKLPPAVRKFLLFTLTAAAAPAMKRLARKLITPTAIAKSFVRVLTEKNVGGEQGGQDHLSLCPEGIETIPLAGTHTPHKF
jgi:hypothetical protein